MKVFVKYKNLNPPTPQKQVNNTELMEIRNQMINDMGWGSGSSDYKAVKKLFHGRAEWENYRPIVHLESDNDPHSFVIEFDDE